MTRTRKDDVKLVKSICVAGVILLATSGCVTGAQPRNDINPALQYYSAFLLAPNLSKTDHDFLFTNEWRGQILPARFGQLLLGFDNQFRLLRQAAQANAPCDWGIDMSPGPATLLPHIGQAKEIAQIARLRAIWDLRDPRRVLLDYRGEALAGPSSSLGLALNRGAADAVDDLLAALALGRNAARDGTLISALVQVAVENTFCSTVAENFYQLPPESLKQLADGLATAPTRRTMASCLPLEKAIFVDWLRTKIEEFLSQPGANENIVMNKIGRLLFGMFSQETNERAGGGSPEFLQFWAHVLNSSTGSASERLLKWLEEAEPFYQRAAIIMALPQPEYEGQIKQLRTDIQKASNPVLTFAFPDIEKARVQEFAIEAQLAMVRAAWEYKLHGDAGLNSVQDPFGKGPFVIKRFLLAGKERGFELQSKYAGRGFQEVMIFVENNEFRFVVSGRNAGQVLPYPNENLPPLFPWRVSE